MSLSSQPTDSAAIETLINDPSRHSSQLLTRALSNIDVDPSLFLLDCESLETEPESGALILVSRASNESTGEVFIRLFRQNKTIAETTRDLLTTRQPETLKKEALRHGFKQIFDSHDTNALTQNLLSAIDTMSLSLSARVLLIENGSAITDKACTLLMKNSASVTHLRKTSFAKSVIDSADFDLIICEHTQKNDKNCGELIDFIRNLEDRNKSDTPILVIAGDADEATRNALFKRGANDFIINPFDKTELLVRATSQLANIRLLRKTRQQQQQILSDPLTGLYNRNTMFDIGSKYVNSARRDENPLSLLVIKLDHFHQMHCSHGSETSNRVLQGVASILTNFCREGDMVSHLRDANFAAVLANCHLQDAQNKALSLLDEIRALQTSGVTVTASIGVAELAASDDFGQLFGKADAAACKALENGHNQIQPASSGSS